MARRASPATRSIVRSRVLPDTTTARRPSVQTSSALDAGIQTEAGGNASFGVVEADGLWVVPVVVDDDGDLWVIGLVEAVHAGECGDDVAVRGVEHVGDRRPTFLVGVSGDEDVGVLEPELLDPRVAARHGERAVCGTAAGTAPLDVVDQRGG